MAAGGLLLLKLPTALAGWLNITNPSQREVFTEQMCHNPILFLVHAPAEGAAGARQLVLPAAGRPCAVLLLQERGQLQLPGMQLNRHFSCPRFSTRTGL